MKLRILIYLFIIITSLLIAPSLAANKYLSYTSAIPKTLTDWDKNHSLPLFDPALGKLTSVTFYITINGTMDGKAENLGPSWANSSFLRSIILMQVTMPDSSDLSFSKTLRYPSTGFIKVSPYDGLTDYAGPDTIAGNASGYESQTKVYALPADLALYIASFPGETKDFPCHVEAASSASGSGNFQSIFETMAGSYAKITYGYDDLNCLSGYKLDGCGNIGLPGWTIKVNNSTKSWTTVTNSTGCWQICNLGNGTYTVCETS